MIEGVIIARERDALIFCEVMEKIQEPDKNAAKLILNNIKYEQSPGKGDLPSYKYYYSKEGNIIYLVITSKGYLENPALQFLEQINLAFLNMLKEYYKDQVDSCFKELEKINCQNMFESFGIEIRNKMKNYLKNDNSSNNETLNKETSGKNENKQKNLRNPNTSLPIYDHK